MLASPLKNLLFSVNLIFVNCLVASSNPIHVFVVAGQSNAVGFGTNASSFTSNPKDANIRFFYRVGSPPRDSADSTSGGQWTTLGAQTNNSSGNFRFGSGGYGPEIGIGRSLFDAISEPIAIIKVAYNATNLHEDWSAVTPSGYSLYPSLVSDINTALNLLIDEGYAPSLSGFFWMQGENDAKDQPTGFPAPAQPDAADHYASNLQSFVQALQTEFSAEKLIFVLARITDQTSGSIGFSYNLELWNRVREAQVVVGESNSLFAWVDTDDLSKSDWVHFDNSGMDTLGARFAEAWLSVLERPDNLDFDIELSPDKTRAVIRSHWFEGMNFGFYELENFDSGTWESDVTIENSEPFSQRWSELTWEVPLSEGAKQLFRLKFEVR
jgi:hypothetical protein